MNPAEAELLRVNQRLLDAIAGGDWNTYQELCDPGLTAIEPESHGQLVEGLPFHKFYFDLGGVRGPHHTTVAAPHVRVVGEVGLVVAQRLVQRLNREGVPTTVVSAETRVWRRTDAGWRHIHFHRTTVAG